MRLLAFVGAIVTVCAVVSCSGEKKDFIDISVDNETVPTMKTFEVETLVSDSGIIRYKITAPSWLVFEEAKEPRWTFGQGLQLEKYDNNHAVDATFECDSAIYLSQRRLWEFIGYVNMTNMAKEHFETEHLFWDQRDRKVYTDSFIHIEKSDRIIEGYGFVSNESMSDYSVNRVSGIFPVSDMRRDTTATDTVSPLPADSVAKKRQPRQRHGEQALSIKKSQ